jgi:hypothetical protein
MNTSRSTSLQDYLIHDSGCTRSLVDEHHASVSNRRMVKNLPYISGVGNGRLQPIGLGDLNLGKFVMQDCLLVPSGNFSLISARELAEKLGYISILGPRKGVIIDPVRERVVQELLLVHGLYVFPRDETVSTALATGTPNTEGLDMHLRRNWQKFSLIRM